jgi:hypothetical protein
MKWIKIKGVRIRFGINRNGKKSRVKVFFLYLQMDVTLGMVCSPDFVKSSAKEKSDENEDPKGIWQIHEALVNYATLMHVLWPYHYAFIVIWRLLVEVRFGELISGNRVAVVTRFFNAITKENIGRATRGQEPLDFDSAKKKWDRIVCASFPKTVPGSAAATQQERSRLPAGGRGGGNAGGRGGQQKARNVTPRASFRGGPVCFAFNQVGGCGRPAAPGGGGCTDNGVTPPRLYHHVCNFFTKATNAHCLKQHPRHNNH